MSELLMFAFLHLVSMTTAPDMVIFLNLTLEEQVQRGDWGQERYEKTEFQKKVGDVYGQLREEHWQEVREIPALTCNLTNLRF